jgi:hypothetical protein
MSGILALIFKMIGGIIGDVLKDILKSPAKETSVEEDRGTLDLPSTPVDDLFSEYDGLLDRG